MHKKTPRVAEPTAKKQLPQKPVAAPPSEGPHAAAFLAAIGREVRKNRAKRGMTRRQLAQASATSERYLAQIESGAGNPSVSVLRAIAQALDLPTAALLPEHGARTAELGAILDLLAQVPESELPALAKEIEARAALRSRRRPGDGASRWSVCAAPANRHSGACSRSISAGRSSSSTAVSRRITAPAFPI